MTSMPTLPVLWLNTLQAHHAEELPLWVQKALWPAIRAEQELRRLEWGKKAPPKVETTSAAAAKAA